MVEHQYLFTLCCRYVTGFMKTVLKGTKTKIHFVPTHDKIKLKHHPETQTLLVFGYK